MTAAPTGQEREREQRWLDYQQREKVRELDKLTLRFGEWYRIWWDGGLFWAERDGDKLSGDSATALAYMIADHMALLRDRPQRCPSSDRPETPERSRSGDVPVPDSPGS